MCQWFLQNNTYGSGTCWGYTHIHTHTHTHTQCIGTHTHTHTHTHKKAAAVRTPLWCAWLWCPSESLRCHCCWLPWKSCCRGRPGQVMGPVAVAASYAWSSSSPLPDGSGTRSSPASKSPGSKVTYKLKWRGIREIKPHKNTTCKPFFSASED